MKKQLKYAVVKTAFHGGGIVSKHYFLDRAEKAAKKWTDSNCSCGCCGIVKIDELENIPYYTPDMRYDRFCR